MGNSLSRGGAFRGVSLSAASIAFVAVLHSGDGIAVADPSTPLPNRSFEGLGIPDAEGAGFPTVSTTASLLSRDGTTVLANGFDLDGGGAVDRWTSGSGWERLFSSSFTGGVVGSGLSDDGRAAVGTIFLESGASFAQQVAPPGLGPVFETYDSTLCPAGAFGSRAGHQASGLSADGSAAAGNVLCRPFQAGSPPESLATRFLPGGAQVLGALSGDTKSEAGSISADGEVVVGRSEGAGGVRIFRWSGSSGMELLPTPLGVSARVSADGSAVAGFAVSGADAYLWNVGLGTTLLGDLPGGGTQTRVGGLSDDGSVVFGMSQSASGDEAFRFTRAGGIVGLGDLAGGAFASRALASTADGATIFGSSRTGPGPSDDEAFVWTASEGMRRVVVVLARHGLPVAGWKLLDVVAVSADGRTWLGNGIDSAAVRQPWLATLPPPSVLRACEDGLDDDGDGLVDMADPGCNLLQLTSESPQCSDGIDDDSDGQIDWPADALCLGPWDDDEAADPASSCGLLGVEPLLLVAVLRRKRRR